MSTERDSPKQGVVLSDLDAEVERDTAEYHDGSRVMPSSVPAGHSNASDESKSDTGSRIQDRLLVK